MKVFIVFSGLMIIGVMTLTYHGDMMRYAHGQAFLKYTAEECAAGAALCLNQKEFAEGRMVFDYDAGQKYAEEHVNYVKNKVNMGKVEGISCALEFEDDSLGYSKDNTLKRPRVFATVKVETGDMFRLPFIEMREVVRKSQYQLVI